jgi:hypothetical protein
MENAKRVLEGRRPVHGGPAHTTLIDESIVRPSAKHNYFSRTRTALGWMTSTELAVFERHLAHEASLGTRILECTYDTVPTDKIREVQYYWSAPLTYLSAWYPRPETFGIRHSSLKALELALSRASHEGRVRHPFRDYGPPRNECPARLDPGLPRREIVDVVVERRPTIAASSVTVVRDPVIKQESNDTLNYDYGPAPEDFVPPIPALDAMGVSITMEKQGAGALSRVRVWSADNLFGRFYQTPDWKEWLKTRPADAKLVSSDFVAASLDSSRNSAKYRPGKSLGMDCSYLDEQLGFIESVYFWFKTRPEVAEPLRLKARVADHPMLQIKSPRDSCPATLGEARALK